METIKIPDATKPNGAKNAKYRPNSYSVQKVHTSVKRLKVYLILFDFID
jgi:hypothetical protein